MVSSVLVRRAVVTGRPSLSVARREPRATSDETLQHGIAGSVTETPLRCVLGSEMEADVAPALGCLRREPVEVLGDGLRRPQRLVIAVEAVPSRYGFFFPCGTAFIATAFAQDDAETARAQWRKVADQLRPKVQKLAKLMDEAEADVLAYMTFPKDHRSKIHSTNPLERVNGEIKRRTEVVGIFPNEEAIVRLVGSILLEQNDEWAVRRAPSASSWR